MTRWNWTWEEPSPEQHQEPGEASEPPTDRSPERERILRRRRIAAAALTLVAVAALALALGALGSHGHHRRPSATLRRPAKRTLTAAQRNAVVTREQERAIERVLSYTPFVVQGGGEGHDVALTFDDGPGPYTQRLVETLNSLHVQGTFFAIGEEERYFSAGTTDELRSGDTVGDHTETHPMMALLSPHEQHEELLEPIYRIELLGGPRPRLFRPPYGSFDATTFKELRKLGLLMVLWSTDTSDYRLPGVSAIVDSALAGAHPGAIILLHDAGGERSQTIAALPQIVKGLRRRGLQPVTVPRLLLDDPPPPGQPIPKSLSGG